MRRKIVSLEVTGRVVWCPMWEYEHQWRVRVCVLQGREMRWIGTNEPVDMCESGACRD